MSSSQNRQRDARCAGLALARIGDLGLTPSPNAYVVFFTYFEGASTELNRQLDHIFLNNLPISDKTVTELYNQFCLKSDETFILSQLAGSVADELGKLLGIIGDAGRNTSEYKTTLESASDRLSANVGSTDVRDIISRVLVETQSVVAHSQMLERKLIDSASTINSLSEELTSVRREAITDPLTGLANRAEFQRVMTAAMQAADCSLSQLCLLVVDIDHFKRVNDTYGHIVGDKILKLTATTLQNNIKGKDLAARFGGEEFVVVLCDAGIEQGKRIAEVLRKAVSEQAIVRKSTGERKGNVTVSIGVAEFAFGDTSETLIERADRALYLAKNSGRNQVKTEDDLEDAAGSPDDLLAPAAG